MIIKKKYDALYQTNSITYRLSDIQSLSIIYPNIVQNKINLNDFTEM